MKKVYAVLPALFFLFATPQTAQAQASACPAVNAGADVTICSGQCTNLTATVQGSVGTNTYSVSTIPYSPYSYTTGTAVLINIDDTWSPTIALPFCFKFFGTTYNSFVIGSNGLISFNAAAYANTTCQWPISVAIPSTGNPVASIMCPYHDIDPSVGSTSDVRYQVYGTAPCREMVVSWYHVPMFSSACNASLATQQLVLHETTNIIDMYIENKPLCSSWNSGAAIEGIQDITGTLAAVVPGRNYPTQWTATNDGKRFMPTGAPNYTIQWTGPSGVIGTTATVSVCPTTTTTYTCTVTNTTCAAPIVVSDQVVVNVTPGITLGSTQTNVLCNGNCNGTISANVISGTGPYTWDWLPGSPTGDGTPNVSNLCAGTYTVNVSGAGGCTGSQTVTVTQPTAVTTTASQTNISCNGACNGSATVTPSGGTPGYTYTWAPSGGSGSSATGLCPGTYTCTIRDANNCTITQSFNITQPSAVTATQTQTNILCNGSCTGVASVSASGGTPGYTYSWAPSGGSGASATALCAGTYTCTIRDANNCTITRSFTITQPPAISVTPTQTNVLCNGSCTGVASVAVSGGTPGYTYTWAPSGGSGASATALCAGTYTCTIRDANNCTVTQSFNITQPPAITVTPTQTNVACNGTCTGVANVAVSGGTPGYTYSWAPTGGSGASATALCAGTYTCTITDANGCSRTQSFSITQPPALTASSSSTPATCSANNGTTTATPSGGTPGYTYSWSPSGGSGATATGLGPGIFTCTITDSRGCTVATTTTVTSTAGMTASITASSNVLCFGGSTGSLTAAPSGGTGPYTYSWAASGGNAATTTGIPAGSYTCTITDANGCSATASASITQPTAITIVPAQTNVSCNGGCNGSATVTPSGGTPGYTYSWAPAGGTGATATGLCAGTYTCTVHDANNCTAIQTFTITQPSAITIVPSQTNVSCYGGCTGSATVTPSGGTPGYSYSWAPSGITNISASGLCAATQTCTITDANGCTATQTFNITQPTQLTATTSSTSSTCTASNGTATATPSGGTSPYTYAWSSGGNGSTTTGLGVGTYNCVITDFAGCTTTVTATVTATGGITASITASTNVSCFGGNNGSATAAPGGGSAPYTYTWASSGGNNATAPNLTAGSYTCTIVDNFGCTATASVTITQPTALTASITASSNVLCNGGSTGSATAAGAGGTTPYSYAWTPSGGNNATANSLPANVYTCTVTDFNGCTTTTTVNITEPTAVTAAITSSTNVSCNGGNDGTATGSGSGGTAPLGYAWTPSGGNAASATNLAANIYTLTVTDANGCSATATVNITEPPALTATSSNVSSTCGASNGSATVNPSGGTPTYSYSWNTTPVQNTATASNIPQGNYVCTITDSKGCTITVSVTVTDQSSPTVTISTFTNVTCFGASDGMATGTGSGGTGPLSYAWTPSGGNAPAATGLGPNTYTCTVTDANGCLATASVTITEPPALAVSATSQTDVLCFGNSTGDASVTISGGSPTYTYAWTPSGGSNNSASSLAANSYTCTVTDLNGCTITQTFTITEPPQLTVAAAGFDATCFGACNGQVVVIPNGGVQPYQYSWNSGCTNPSCNNMCAGTYTIDITDANGCTAQSTATVNEPTQITLSSSAVDAHCNQTDGSATVVANGGTPGYTYQWSSGGTNATEPNLSPNTYSVIVTDNLGCVDTITATVNNLNGVNGTLSASTNVTCFNACNGAATVTAAGGNQPYAYSWPSGGSNASESNLCAGNYNCTITDADGCTSTVNVVITQPTQLTVTANAAVSICNGATANIGANIGGGTPVYAPVWTPGNLAGANQTVTPSATQTYTITVTDANGCTATANQTVTVNAVPVVALTAATTSGCAPLCTGFTDGSSIAPPATITSWNWDFGDGNTSTQQTPSNCYTTAGSYNVLLTVTSSDGCTNSITMPNYINVFPNPVAGFTFSPTNATIANPVIDFTDASTGATQWMWNFGDLANSSSTSQNPSFTYADSGSYQITQVVVNSDGCADTATDVVHIGGDYIIFVPNAFTPNEDGVNDVFHPVFSGVDAEKYELWIFDRWGNLIFYTDDINKGWDGVVQNGRSELVSQIDTYVWKIKLVDFRGDLHRMIGKVTLIK